MPKQPPDETSTLIQAQQAARLRRLRMIVQPVQRAAAETSGMTYSQWSRMETGETTIDAIHLSRWCAAYGFGAEYVISGRYAGLPDYLVRLVVAVEAHDVTEFRAGREAPADSAALAANGPSDTSHERSRNGRPRTRVTS